jgi:hypothetical protein
MPELDTQIREYIDATSQAISIDQLYEQELSLAGHQDLDSRRLVETRTGHGGRTIKTLGSTRRGLLVAAAVMALVLVVFGILNWSAGDVAVDPMEPAPESPTTTLIDPERPETFLPQPLDGTNFELVWTISDSATEVLPDAPIPYDGIGGSSVEGYHWLYPGYSIWWSDDGVNWRTDNDELAAQRLFFEPLYGEVALAEGVGSTPNHVLVRRVNDSLQPIPLPEAPGLRLQEHERAFDGRGAPVQSGDTILVPGSDREVDPDEEWPIAGWISYDRGATFTTIALPYPIGNAIALPQGGFALYPTSDTDRPIFTSEDGHNWIEQPSSSIPPILSGSVQMVAQHDGAIAALISGGTSAPTLWRSFDGVNWIEEVPQIVQPDNKPTEALQLRRYGVSSILWGASNGVIQPAYYSLDNGETWTKTEVPMEDAQHSQRTQAGGLEGGGETDDGFFRIQGSDAWTRLTLGTFHEVDGP